MQVRKLFAENTVPVHITACLFMYLPFKNSLRSLSCASKVFARAARSIFHQPAGLVTSLILTWQAGSRSEFMWMQLQLMSRLLCGAFQMCDGFAKSESD